MLCGIYKQIPHITDCTSESKSNHIQLPGCVALFHETRGLPRPGHTQGYRCYLACNAALRIGRQGRGGEVQGVSALHHLTFPLSMCGASV